MAKAKKLRAAKVRAVTKKMLSPKDPRLKTSQERRLEILDLC